MFVPGLRLCLVKRITFNKERLPFIATSFYHTDDCDAVYLLFLSWSINIIIILIPSYLEFLWAGINQNYETYFLLKNPIIRIGHMVAL